MNVVERAKAPTPKFFKVLRTIGLALLAVSGSIVAAPVALPAVVVTVAGYVDTSTSSADGQDNIRRNKKDEVKPETYVGVNG
jgi:hypothetical protein